MVRKIAICILALIVAYLVIGCGNDPFKNDNIEIKAYSYRVVAGDTLDDIIGEAYKCNTVFVDWATYRQKHFDLNAELTRNGRFLQIGDTVIIYTIHKKKGN